MLHKHEDLLLNAAVGLYWQPEHFLPKWDWTGRKC